MMERMARFHNLQRLKALARIERQMKTMSTKELRSFNPFLHPGSSDAFGGRAPINLLAEHPVSSNASGHSSEPLSSSTCSLALFNISTVLDRVCISPLISPCCQPVNKCWVGWLSVAAYEAVAAMAHPSGTGKATG